MAKWFATAGTFALLSFASTAAMAQEDNSFYDKLDIDALLNFQYIGEENNDLGSSNEDYEDSISEQFQLLIGANFTPDIYGFFHGRALNIDGETGFDDDTGDAIPLDQSFLELRQLYLRFEDLFDYDPAYIQVGRQRIREPRAIWWNSDQDLIKAGIDSTLFSAFLAAGENLSSYRNNTDIDFQADDEDRFRVLGEASWQYTYNHFFETRFLYEDDHSGLESVGTLIPANDRDDEDQELFWAGVRAAGEFTNFDNPYPRIKYRADLIGLTGEKSLLSTVSAGTDFRSVTGGRTRDVRAWAFDGNLLFNPFEELGVVFGLGYAFGSGEDDPNGTGTSNEFRQSDLDGNSSRLGLERNQQRNYGEVLRPELSNLHIANAGVAVPFSEYSDVAVNYFYYHLDEETTRLHSSSISAPMNNSDKEVGHAIDVGLYVDLDDEFNFELPYTRDVDFRAVFGSFIPGDAYQPNDTDKAFRIFTEVKFRF
ncbi:MAG: alginate export family protein [Alphaproteobacteria bacterium]